MDGTQHAAAGHPLDPLTAPEVAAATAIVRASDGYGAQSDRCRFITIALQEPAKDGVLEWEAGGPRPAREAEVVLLDRGRAETIEAVVSLDDGAVIGWNVRTDVQPMAVVAELMEAEELLRLHPEFQAALAAPRGHRSSSRSRSTPGRPGTSAVTRNPSGGSPGAWRS